KIGYFLIIFRESLTITLRKEGKADYSLLSSYRPIVLKNTLGKVLERLVIERLSEILKKNSLLPGTQFSARKQRSVNSVVSLLTEVTRVAWNVNPANIVSVLSLDLTTAFDNVSYKRLLKEITKKGLLLWLREFIHGFVTS